MPDAYSRFKEYWSEMTMPRREGTAMREATIDGVIKNAEALPKGTFDDPTFAYQLVADFTAPSDPRHQRALESIIRHAPTSRVEEQTKYYEYVKEKAPKNSELWHASVEGIIGQAMEKTEKVVVPNVANSLEDAIRLHGLGVAINTPATDLITSDPLTVAKRYMDAHPKTAEKLNAIVSQIDNEYKKNSALDPSRQIPHELETRYGLQDIAGHYKIASGKSWSEIENSAKQRFVLVNELNDALSKGYFDLGNSHSSKRVSIATGDPLHDAISVVTRDTDAENLMLFNRQLNEFTSLNPELKELRVDRGNSRSVYDAILGTTTGFNVADQNHYVSGGRFSDWSLEEQKKLGAAGIEWAASQSTLNKIASQLPHDKLLDVLEPQEHAVQVEIKKSQLKMTVDASKAGYSWLGERVASMGVTNNDGTVTLNNEHSKYIQGQRQQRYNELREDAITKPTAEGAVGHASALYTAAIQGKQALQDLEQGHYVGAAINGLSAGVGGTELLGQAIKNEQLLDKLGTKGQILGVGVDLYNAGRSFTEGKGVDVATDHAAQSLVKAGEYRAAMVVGNKVAGSVGGLAAANLLTMVETGTQNIDKLQSAKEAMGAINANMDTFRHLRESIVSLEHEKDSSTGQPLLSGLTMRNVPVIENGKPVTKDGKPLMSQQPDLADPANQEKIHVALERERNILLSKMDRNSDRMAIAVPLIGNITDSTFETMNNYIQKHEDNSKNSQLSRITNLPVKKAIGFIGDEFGKMDGLSSNPMLNDPEAIARYAAAEVQKKQIDVSIAELSHLADTVKYVSGDKEKTASQTHDDVVLAKRAGEVPVKNYAFTLQRGNMWTSDKYIAGSDKNEPLPAAALKAFKADPEKGRVYEQVLYKRDAQGEPLRDTHGKLIAGEVKRWEIIDPEKQRQADLGMTAKEQQQAFGATWKAELRIEAKEKSETLRSAFGHAAEQFAHSDSQAAQTGLVDSYQKYHNQLKYMQENAQALGLDKEELKAVNTSLARSVVDFNQAFDPKLQAVKEANAKAQSEHNIVPVAVNIADQGRAVGR